MTVPEAPTVLLLGARGQRFRVEATAAHTGGQALVHFGVDEESGRPVAVKVAIEPLGAGAWLDAERALLEELGGLPALRDHVVPVLDHGAWGTRRWFAMPRYGDTLASFVARRPELAERLAAALAVATAVAALHAAAPAEGGDPRFVHHDLKPTNVMRADDGTWRLADFGAARHGAAPIGATTSPLYSRGFAPPEQTLPLRQAASAAWDRYALAATVYFCAVGRAAIAPMANGLCLTPLGRRVVAGRDAGAVGPEALLDLRRMAALDEEDRRALAAVVSPRLVGVIARMLAPDARRRVGTPDTLAAALRAELQHPWAGQRSGHTRTLVGVSAFAITALSLRLVSAPATAPAESACVPVDGHVCVTPTGLRLARAPAGRFQAGDGADARVEVIERPFLIGETEVTQGLWEEVMGENPVRGRQLASDDGSLYGSCAANVDASVGRDLPVQCVTLAEVVRFLDALSAREGLDPACVVDDSVLRCDATRNGYRVPTDAEWEYAARAGTTGPLPGPGDDCAWGNVANAPTLEMMEREALAASLPAGDEDAGVQEAPIPTAPTCDDGYPDTAPVGRFRPNAWGLRDVVGNAEELTLGPDGPHQRGRPLLPPYGHGSALSTVQALRARSLGGWGVRVARSLPIVDEIAVVRLSAEGVPPVDMAVTEVTQGEWRALLGEEPARTAFDTRTQFRCDAIGKGAVTGDDLPAMCVDWDDAVRFANARSDHDGLRRVYQRSGDTFTADPDADGWRLPSVAEWRLAFGAHPFPGADTVDALCRHANVLDRGVVDRARVLTVPCDDGYPALAPVGTMLPNEHQLFDLAGNVWEWTGDTVDDDPALRAVVGGGWTRLSDDPVGTPDAYYGRDARVGLQRTHRSQALGLRLVKRAR